MSPLTVDMTSSRTDSTTWLRSSLPICRRRRRVQRRRRRASELHHPFAHFFIHRKRLRVDCWWSEGVYWDTSVPVGLACDTRDSCGTLPTLAVLNLTA